MVPLSRRMLTDNRGRFVITIGGVALMVLLMLFLIGVHRGAVRGATGYVQDTRADLWVAAQNSNNLLRSSSFISSVSLEPIRQLDGVREMTGLLRFISTGRVGDRTATLFIFGFDPQSILARPIIVAGSNRLESGEVAVDQAFAAKYDLTLGDSISIQEIVFVVSGLTRNTNALVAQFTFMRMDDAQRLFGFSNVVSFALLALEHGADIGRVSEQIQRHDLGLASFPQSKFIQNNLDEMETGVLPILWTIAVFGSLSGTAVLTLLLYSSVQERRQDYALLAALGAPHTFLFRVVITQSLLAGMIGFGAGLAAFICSVPVLSNIVPEMELVVSVDGIIYTLAAALVVGTSSAWASIGKLRRIYPGEVFGG